MWTNLFFPLFFFPYQIHSSSHLLGFIWECHGVAPMQSSLHWLVGSWESKWVGCNCEIRRPVEGKTKWGDCKEISKQVLGEVNFCTLQCFSCSYSLWLKLMALISQVSYFGAHGSCIPNDMCLLRLHLQRWLHLSVHFPSGNRIPHHGTGLYWHHHP